MTQIADFQIEALNDAQSSENRIHSDEIAEKFGFRGALVSGVNVFGYMSQALIQSLGEEILNKGFMQVRFLKPAYEHDLVSVKSEPAFSVVKKRYNVSKAYNQDGELLAQLDSWISDEPAPIDKLANVSKGKQISERQEIKWDLINLLEPSPTYLWKPSKANNLQRVSSQRDDSPLYKGDDAYIHPYYLLDACNKALMRMFILPAWIHVGSKLHIREPMRINEEIAVHAVPVRKWLRKGHQFIELYICMKKENRVVLEAEHTAIYRIAT
jgi:acyl dehydratase